MRTKASRKVKKPSVAGTTKDLTMNIDSYIYIHYITKGECNGNFKKTSR